MSFSTLPFLFYFLPAFLAVYYIVPARFRNAVLALGSLLFYWLSAGTGALLVLILVNFAAGRLIEDAHGDERRAWLILALACDVGSLFYFKYMGWFLENLGRLTNTDFSFFRVALPLGVSFYVFQSIAYIADVYRGDAEAERSLLDYAAFQAMFPQLVMGSVPSPARRSRAAFRFLWSGLAARSFWPTSSPRCGRRSNVSASPISPRRWRGSARWATACSFTTTSRATRSWRWGLPVCSAL